MWHGDLATGLDQQMHNALPVPSSSLHRQAKTTIVRSRLDRIYTPRTEALMRCCEMAAPYSGGGTKRRRDFRRHFGDLRNVVPVPHRNQVPAPPASRAGTTGTTCRLIYQ